MTPLNVYTFDGHAMRAKPQPAIALPGDIAWLCGGHPSIRELAPVIRETPGLVLALNSTALIVPATIAVCLDEPAAYPLPLLLTPWIKIVARLNYVDRIVAGERWRDHDNVVFIGDTATDDHDWLNDGGAVWFKSGFCFAIQLLYRMGFRKIVLAGCAFKDAGQYAYGERPELAKQNARLYAKQVEWLRHNGPYFDACGLEIFNATPGTAADFLLEFSR